MIIEPGSSGINDELAEFGAAQTLYRARNGHSALRITPGSDPTARHGWAPEDACGVRMVLRGDDDYPTQLEDLDEPPLALWVWGNIDLRLTATRSVCVVGARAASQYGQRVGYELAHDLAMRDWAVVSGAAFGIDAAAHRGALNADGPTIAVLACGIDIAYPRAHENLIAAIARSGAVITELPPGSAPLKFRFLARNRIIAALTRGCVIVEAAQRSGAISTANRALELARPLMAVPGPIDVVTSTGTNRLLHDGSARLVRDARDVVEVILGEPDAGGAALDLPPEAQLVAASLTGSPLSVGQLAASTQLDRELVAAMLGLLELSGRATRTARGWTAR
jgi:DNA processing protein